jgi:hypothetical protein
VYEKRCAFCDYRSGDSAEFANHIRSAHPSFFKAKAPRQRGFPYEGALTGFAYVVGGCCGFLALVMVDLERLPTASEIPAIYRNWFGGLGQFLVPMAALLAFLYPRRSYRWGLVIGWAMLPVSALYTGIALLGFVLSPVFGFTDSAESLVGATAYFAIPALLVTILCATGWLAAALRRRVKPG